MDLLKMCREFEESESFNKEVFFKALEKKKLTITVGDVLYEVYELQKAVEKLAEMARDCQISIQELEDEIA